jgi:putative methanogenesis marker protein 8
VAKHKVEMAKSKVLIEDGRVKVLSPPLVKRCPLRRNLYGCEEEDEGTVKRVLESHIHELGMYTPDRVLELEDEPVTFGASEMINDALRQGILDAAVLVCEGVGTVIIDRPKVIQAVGAHMTGILETQPIPRTRKRLEMLGCKTLGNCEIDQVQGFVKAVSLGYERIAVTVSGDCAADTRALRRKGVEKERRPLILAVHTSGISKRSAETLAKYADVVWGCASKQVREAVGPKALLQIGTGIPVFALTMEGKEIVLNRALRMSSPLLIKRAKLPSLEAGRQPSPLL